MLVLCCHVFCDARDVIDELYLIKRRVRVPQAKRVGRVQSSQYKHKIREPTAVVAGT